MNRTEYQRQARKRNTTEDVTKKELMCFRRMFPV